MAEYSEILNTEIEADQPLREGTMTKMRDNPEAFSQGSATVPNSKRVDPAGFKRPTATAQTAVLAHQGQSQLLGDDNGVVRFFQGVVVVPGVYTFAGTRSTATSNSAKVYVNDVEDYSASTASFSHEMTLVAGDQIRVDVERTSSASMITLTNFRLLSEYFTPMCQCQFNRFVGVLSAS